MKGKTNNLDICTMNNPAIYVFELKKIIYGCESYWSVIDDPNDFNEITKEVLDNVWYVQLLKEFYEKKRRRKKNAIPKRRYEKNIRKSKSSLNLQKRILDLNTLMQS